MVVFDSAEKWGRRRCGRRPGRCGRVNCFEQRVPCPRNLTLETGLAVVAVEHYTRSVGSGRPGARAYASFSAARAEFVVGMRGSGCGSRRWVWCCG
jgi:hypothetical protein